MKGKCRYEEEGKGFERKCKLHDQYLAGNREGNWDTCQDCEDYEESEA